MKINEIIYAAYVCDIDMLEYVTIPVVQHKAVAEVSKIGNL